MSFFKKNIFLFILLLSPVTTLALTDIAGSQLFFDMDIPANWVKFSNEYLKERNAIQGYHKKDSEFPKMLIKKHQKQKIPYTDLEISKLILDNNNLHNGTDAYVSSDKKNIFLETIKNYETSGKLVFLSVLNIDNSISLNFVSQYDQYKKDKVEFEKIVKSIKSIKAEKNKNNSIFSLPFLKSLFTTNILYIIGILAIFGVRWMFKKRKSDGKVLN